MKITRIIELLKQEIKGKCNRPGVARSLLGGDTVGLESRVYDANHLLLHLSLV